MRKPRSARQLRQSVAANVRTGRTRSGLTQQELADATGLDLRYLQRIEHGEINLTLETLAILADTLGATAESLLQEAELPKARRGRPPKP